MTNYYTENLAEFGHREIKMLNDTLTAWMNHGLPEGFENSGVKPAMNKSSGYVFLVNDDYQVAMLNDDNQLKIYHSLPHDGAEGFLTDLITELSPQSLNSDDLEYILNAAESERIELDESWKSE